MPTGKRQAKATSKSPRDASAAWRVASCDDRRRLPATSGSLSGIPDADPLEGRTKRFVRLHEAVARDPWRRCWPLALRLRMRRPGIYRIGSIDQRGRDIPVITALRSHMICDPTAGGGRMQPRRWAVEMRQPRSSNLIRKPHSNRSDPTIGAPRAGQPIMGTNPPPSSSSKRGAAVYRMGEPSFAVHVARPGEAARRQPPQELSEKRKTRTSSANHSTA